MSPLVLEPVPRRPSVPAWAVAIVAAWLAAVAAFVALSPVTGTPVLCAFRRVTGVPCPTCGATRGVLAIANGHPMDALLLNPLLFAVGGAVAALLAVRVLFGRRVALRLDPPWRRAAWGVATLAFLANWAYVIAQT
jgi:hypothetical protein